MADHEHERIVDGRTLRRERGRRAVIDAMIDLVLEGHTPPSASQVAERAEVSQASLFRYFATLDELRRDAIGRYFERFDELIAIPDIGEGRLRVRIDRLVRSRDAFYKRTAPMAHLTRRHAADVDDFGETIVRLRATFADQIAQHFAPELDPLDTVERVQRVAVIAVLTSFEGWDQLAPLGDRGRRDALRQAISDLLGTDSRPGTR